MVKKTKSRDREEKKSTKEGKEEGWNRLRESE